MKKLYVETNGYNMVLFVDKGNMAYIVSEKSFDEPLTLEVAKKTDYSNLDNCETAEECRDAMSFGDIIKFDQNSEDYESVTEFYQINVAANIKAARLAAGISQTQLAEEVRTTQAQIARYESGEQDPTISRLVAIAEALKISPQDLLL